MSLMWSRRAMSRNFCWDKFTGVFRSCCWVWRRQHWLSDSGEKWTNWSNSSYFERDTAMPFNNHFPVKRFIMCHWTCRTLMIRFETLLLLCGVEKKLADSLALLFFTDVFCFPFFSCLRIAHENFYASFGQQQKGRSNNSTIESRIRLVGIQIFSHRRVLRPPLPLPLLLLWPTNVADMRKRIQLLYCYIYICMQ